MTRPTRTIEIIRCWANGTWDTKEYDFRGSAADPPPSQDGIIDFVLLAEPLDTNEHSVAACFYYLCQDPTVEDDLDAWGKAIVRYHNSPHDPATSNS